MTTEPPTTPGLEEPQSIAPTQATTTPSLGGMSGEMMVMVSGIVTPASTWYSV